MADKKRFIHIGIGGHGGGWMRHFTSRIIASGAAEPVAVVDINKALFPEAVAHYKLPPDKCYTKAEKAFAENEADFAIVVTPPAFHEKMVDLALAHKMDVICEKPMADTFDSCLRIYKKVKKAGRKMAVTMTHRFDQDKQSLQRAVESGKYGRIDYISGRNTWSNRACGNKKGFRYRMEDLILIDLLVHHFDVIRALSGSNAETVYAKTWRTPWAEWRGHTQGLITLEMANGVKVLYEGGFCNASTLNDWGNDYWRVECEKATLILDNRRLCAVTGRVNGTATTTSIELEEQPSWRNTWIAERFVSWLNGGPAPETTVEDNIQCAALMFAAIESAHKGQPVDVQRFLKANLSRVKA